MTTILQDDIIDSIATAFQFISYYHPKDFIDALHAAIQKEQSVAAKDAMMQILVNSRLCAMHHRPICQDTGIATVFVNIGMHVRIIGDLSLDEMINEGVRRAYLLADNPLRASVLKDPMGARKNTGDNTPAVIHTKMVKGDKIHITCAAKGGGSENKARLGMLNPSDDVVQWVVDTAQSLGAGWCPPGILGIGIGGTPEKAMLLAKQSLMSHIDMCDIIQKQQSGAALSTLEKMRIDIYHKVNALGIGAQGLGGLTTVLDVKILDYPTHAASKPVAIIPNCAATRHVSFSLDGMGAANLIPPKIDDYPSFDYMPAAGKKVCVDALTKQDLQQFKTGDVLLLTGTIYTARDAAHKRLLDLIERNQPLPVNLDNKLIYYVGPVDAVDGEAVGPAGPTTATRMDKFTDALLKHTNLLGTIGKAERSQQTCKDIKNHGAIYLMAVGGAAYLVSQAIKKARVVAFEDLGMEAMYEFYVEQMPVMVAVDSDGHSVHHTAPIVWRQKIKDGLV